MGHQHGALQCQPWCGEAAARCLAWLSQHQPTLKPGRLAVCAYCSCIGLHLAVAETGKPCAHLGHILLQHICGGTTNQLSQLVNCCMRSPTINHLCVRTHQAAQQQQQQAVGSGCASAIPRHLIRSSNDTYAYYK